MTSIVALIYASTKWADSLWESICLTTGSLPDVRFFFVANDPTEEVLAHLKKKNYPHVVQRNPRLTSEEMKKKRIAEPEYIRRVYQGWNRAIQEGDDWICLVNSDHVFAPGWMEALIRHRRPNKILSCRTYEPNPTRFRNAMQSKLGRTLESFQVERFFWQARRDTRSGTRPGGVYMPSLFSRRVALKVGLYPEGNLLVKGRRQFGDRIFFSRLARHGVQHLTVMNSIAYHFQEGEMRDAK